MNATAPSGLVGAAELIASIRTTVPAASAAEGMKENALSPVLNAVPSHSRSEK
jgi:hypothetical protein